jgi:hypothetical protein
MWDALRMEITNTSANPAVTGWTDYTWVTGPNDNNDEFPNDAASQQPTEVIVPEPSTVALLCAAAVLAVFWRIATAKRLHRKAQSRASALWVRGLRMLWCGPHGSTRPTSSRRYSL